MSGQWTYGNLRYDPPEVKAWDGHQWVSIGNATDIQASWEPDTLIIECTPKVLRGHMYVWAVKK